jgi:hypothetical protein
MRIHQIHAGLGYISLFDFSDMVWKPDFGPMLFEWELEEVPAYTSDNSPRRVLTEAIVSLPWQTWETCGYLHDDPCQGAIIAVTVPAHEICRAIIAAALDAGLIGGE